MPAVELDAEIIRPNSNEQLFHLAERMNEWVFLASPQRARGDIFQPQHLPLIRENLRTEPQTLGMLAKILQVSQIVAAREYPGVDPPDACSLQNRSRRRKFFQVSIEGVQILAEFDRQTSRSKLQISFFQIIEKPMQPIIV